MVTLQLMAQQQPSPINLSSRIAMMQTFQLCLQSLYLTDIRSEYPISVHVSTPDQLGATLVHRINCTMKRL